MKKNYLLLLLLCAIPVAALRPATMDRRARQSRSGGEGVPSEMVGTAATGTAYLVQQNDTDFSDLDVRDAQNHPISAQSAKEKLAELFRENLVNLTVFANPHSITTITNWLDQYSHLFNKTIYTRILVVLSLFQEAYLPSMRRFVHNVHNLCITLLAGSFLSCTLLAAGYARAASFRLIIRC